MQLTRYTDYGLRILMYLSAQPTPQRVSIDDVCRVFGLSRNHVSKIVHQLGKEGWITTTRGHGGGFQLAMPAESMSLGRIVRSLESSLMLVDCESPSPCALLAGCRLRSILDDAMAAFLQVLDGYVLQDLVDGKEIVHLFDSP